MRSFSSIASHEFSAPVILPKIILRHSAGVREYLPTHIHIRISAMSMTKSTMLIVHAFGLFFAAVMLLIYISRIYALTLYYTFFNGAFQSYDRSFSTLEDLCSRVQKDRLRYPEAVHSSLIILRYVVSINALIFSSSA